MHWAFHISCVRGGGVDMLGLCVSKRVVITLSYMKGRGQILVHMLCWLMHENVNPSYELEMGWASS